MYKCHKCGAEFDTWKALQEHLNVHSIEDDDE